MVHDSILSEWAMTTTIRVGKTDQAIPRDGFGTINIYAGPKGRETATGEQVEGVYNRYRNLCAGRWVTLADFGEGPELIAGDC